MLQKAIDGHFSPGCAEYFCAANIERWEELVSTEFLGTIVEAMNFAAAQTILLLGELRLSDCSGHPSSSSWQRVGLRRCLAGLCQLVAYQHVVRQTISDRGLVGLC